MNSSERPNLDFRSLQAAVDRVRNNEGQRDASVNDELGAIGDTPRKDPFRARYPNFRWRLIPAVYCAFYAVMCIGGVVTYDVFGNASFAGYRGVAISVAYSVLFSCAAFCWFRNYWKCGIFFFAAVIVLSNLRGFL